MLLLDMPHDTLKALQIALSWEERGRGCQLFFINILINYFFIVVGLSVVNFFFFIGVMWFLFYGKYCPITSIDGFFAWAISWCWEKWGAVISIIRGAFDRGTKRDCARWLVYVCKQWDIYTNIHFTAFIFFRRSHLIIVLSDGEVNIWHGCWSQQINLRASWVAEWVLFYLNKIFKSMRNITRIKLLYCWKLWIWGVTWDLCCCVV